jgi:hypothetical protein
MYAQDYLYVHALSVEMAEAFAEYLHKRIRGKLGFAAKEAHAPQGDASSMDLTLGTNAPFVMPAKAGIQGDEHRTRGPWTPAYARATKREVMGTIRLFRTTGARLSRQPLLVRLPGLP